MNVSDLIAASPSEYVEIVLRLLRDDFFWLSQAQVIEQRFVPFVGTNNLKVAEEWAEFFVSVLK